MQNKLHSTNYNFKPLFFDNHNLYNEFEPAFFDNGFNNRNCPKCNNPCFGQKPCNNPPPMPPPCPDFRPPCANFPLPPNIVDCSKDNFRYFLIGYLFGGWQ